MKRFLMVLGVALAFVVPVAAPATVAAQGASVDIYRACGSGDSSEICKNKNSRVEPVFKNIINLLLLILGIISVIMIVVGGFMYVTSGGDSNKLTSAKNTIIYSVVGVVVALLAYSIVEYAFSTITKTPGTITIISTKEDL